MSSAIILCGFMGCGKTTVGRLLARKTGRRFVDTDELIEKRAGKSISEIFAESGEEYFRKLEYETVKSLHVASDCIISVGGGAAVRKETAALLRSLGTVVFLDASEEQLLSRLDGSSDRPVLGSGGRKETVSRLLKERMPYYISAADHTVRADGSPKETAESIIKLLEL